MELSTGLRNGVKKSEMKREMSPKNPLKRKAKGKEASPGYMSLSLCPRAGARTRKGVGRYRLAGGAAEELINILGAPHSERNLRTWAFYCYHHDPEALIDRARELIALNRSTGRPRNPVTAFQRWLTDTYGEGAR